MSLITRCPACTTMFKVVPDQLRVSDGWVRCGQCNEVFDANAHLQPGIDQTPSKPAPQPIQNPVAPEPEPEPELEPEPERIEELVAVSEESIAKSELEINSQALQIEQQDIAPPAPTLREQRDNLGRGDPPAPKPKSNSASKPAPLEQASASASKEQSSLSFMRQGRSSSAFWSRSWVRGGLGLVCVLLVGGLLVQVSVHERDRIVATEPSAKQFLKPICEVLNCQIEPLRQIEAIVIESSSFTKVRSDAYRLSFALKNSGQIPIATPAVELTLTDTQDQAVVRRVFTAAEFSQQVLVMDPGAELLATVPVSIKQGAGYEKISGYRLLTFYP